MTFLSMQRVALDHSLAVVHLGMLLIWFNVIHSVEGQILFYGCEMNSQRPNNTNLESLLHS